MAKLMDEPVSRTPSDIHLIPCVSPVVIVVGFSFFCLVALSGLQLENLWLKGLLATLIILAMIRQVSHFLASRRWQLNYSERLGRWHLQGCHHEEYEVAARFNYVGATLVTVRCTAENTVVVTLVFSSLSTPPSQWRLLHSLLRKANG